MYNRCKEQGSLIQLENVKKARIEANLRLAQEDYASAKDLEKPIGTTQHLSSTRILSIL